MLAEIMHCKDLRFGIRSCGFYVCLAQTWCVSHFLTVSVCLNLPKDEVEKAEHIFVGKFGASIN